MKSAFVRIHARLCGDGNICVYETSEEDRNMRGEVVYTNLNDKNLQEFQEDMKEVFDVEMTFVRDHVKVRSLEIIKELEERFGDVSTGEWRIPEEIFRSSKSQKMEWVRAFARDEGYHEERYNRLKIKSMNREGLEDLQDLLKSLEIESSLTGPNCDGSWYLTVPSLDSHRKLFEIASNKTKIRS